MTDGIERELRRLDADRPLPHAVYARLEAALLEEAQVSPGASDEVAAAVFDALDAPRPIPPATRAALERELTGRASRSVRRSLLLLGAAAAVLVVVASVAALRTGESHSDRNVAAGPGPTVPEAGVPPPLHLPTATSAPLPVINGPARTTPPTTRRSTTTTTWNCGLCARNGATGSAMPAGVAASSSGDGGPSGQPVAAAATVAPAEVSTVTPSSGPRRGETTVTLTGHGFTGASGVQFGSSSAANFTVVSDAEIRVMTPASPGPQMVAVSVVYADGSATATSDASPRFTYT